MKFQFILPVKNEIVENISIRCYIIIIYSLELFVFVPFMTVCFLFWWLVLFLAVQIVFVSVSVLNLILLGITVILVLCLKLLVYIYQWNFSFEFQLNSFMSTHYYSVGFNQSHLYFKVPTLPKSNPCMLTVMVASI